MKKLEGRKIKLKDGRIGEIGVVIKRLSGWEYLVHFDLEKPDPDSRCEFLKREDFEYIKEA